MNNKLLFCVNFIAIALMTTSMAFATASVVDISQTNPQGEQVVINDQVAEQGENTQTQSQPQQPAQSSQAIDAAPMTSEPSTTVMLPEQSSLTLSQRLVRIQQQINNLVDMNLPQQMSDLRQELAQLRGQLQVQAHDLKLLNNQQRSFYRDLDQRIDQLKNLNSGGGSGNNNGVNSNANAASPTSNNIRMKESNAYQAAFSFLKKKQYGKSQTAFQEYLNDYPNGQYVSNAHYWLGEIYLAQKNNEQAAQQFQTVISKFPKTPKIGDAKLKLAVIHANMGKIKLARQELMQLKKQHPDSTAAQLANIRLQQLNAVENNSATNRSS